MNVEFKLGKVSKILLISFIVLIVFYGLISSFSVKIEGTRKFSSSFFDTFNLVTGLAVEPQIEVKLKNKYGGEVGFYDLKEGKLIFGLDNSSFNSIVYLSGEQEELTAYLDLTSDNGISTQVISLENIGFSNAIIILEKNNPITSIVKCASFDLGAFSCREWEKLNLEFIEDEKTIRFEVDEKGVYAGYFSLEDLKPEQIKIDIKNKYGNDIIEPNLTDQGFFVEANNSKIELNGVESTMVSVFLDNVQNETIKTSVVYIPSINLDNATVILPKNGNVDVIYKCEYFDLGGFNCLNWVKTNILFEDLGDKILFNVNSFSAYAGGILGAVLALKIGEKKYIEVRNFREQDGGYMLALRPLQYFDNDWKDLYPVNNLSDVDYSHLIVKPNYNILISRDTKKSLMHLKMEDTYVNYALENSLNSIPEFITDNEMQIVFKNIQENTDLRYTLSDKNIKEDIVLKQFGKNRFRFILDNAQGVKVDKKEDGTYKIYDAVNSSMEATVLRPFMYDAVNKRSDAVDISLFVEDSNLILDLIANSSWLESASYPVIIDPTFSVVANSTNAFSCQTNNVTMECRPARNIINFTTTSDVAVLDFNLSNLIIPSTENITAITLQLFCNGSVSNTFSLINVTTPAKIRNETANISGLHQDVMGSSTFLNQNFILSCTNQLTNITFSDTGINEIKKIYNNSNTNLRYYPIGINQTSISVATNSFDNELGSFSPVLYFNTTTSDCGNLNVAGVYTLNNNVNAPGTCFNITSSNVELNCAGFQINYSHKSLGFAVNATNVNNVTIRDCNILQGSNASVNHAVLFTNLTNGSLLNSTIMTIGTDVAGFFATTNTTGVLINGSNITSRQGFAINFTGSSNATITFNNITVSSNDFGSEAIRLDSGNNFTIKSNVIYCARECIRVRGVNFTIIETIINNNNITFNGTLDAIFLQGSKNITISNNNITSTRTDATAARGVRISSSDNVIANNTIRTNSSNTAYAILIEEGSKNKIISNILNSSGATAIFLGPDGDYNVFENNTILQSGNNAFEINGADGGNQMPENNNFTNNTLNNIQNKDLVISDTGINGTRLIDQNIRNYTFTGIGSLIVVKNSTFGEISFFQQVNGSGVNLVGNSSSDIQFSNNSIFVISNSSGNIGLNRSANITIFGTPGQRFINHKILRDGVTCNATTSPSCSNFTALTAVTVIFNVTAFSNYSIGGDTNNTLITCGNINTAGNYSLGNSVNAPGTCFNITASNVELNCGGFEINYSQSSLGFAINVSNVNNVTIKNCNILQGAVISSSNAINFANITNGSLLNTTIETFGLRANGFTAETNSTGILINGSNITIHEGIVINFTESANSSITNNNMTSIVDAGGLVILIGRGVNFTISNNIVYTARGIVMESGNNNTIITNNNFTLNVSNNVLAATSGSLTSYVVFSNNNITYVNPTVVGGATAITITTFRDSNITNNTIKFIALGGDGINVGGVSVGGASRNLILNNLITGNGTNGIRISSRAINNTFENNTINITGPQSNTSFLIFGSGGDNPENNTFINNTLSNISRDNLFLLNSNGTRLIDQSIRNYSFEASGVTLIIRNTTFGEIFYLGAVNGSGNSTTSSSLIGFANSDIQINNNSVFVNDSRNPGLNRSANVSLFGTVGQNSTNPVIFRNTVACNATVGATCFNFTSLRAATVIFNVTGFSNYSIGNATVAAGTNNTVISSNINNSNVTNSVIQNSTITNSTVVDTFTNQSTVIINSTVLRSNLTNSTALDSLIDNSTLANTTVDDSMLNRTTAFNSTIINATITNSTLTNTITQNSTITNSTLTDSFTNFSTQISDSTIINGTILNSTITNSTIQNFTIVNSTIDRSILNQSSIVLNSTLINATLFNDTIRHSTIQNSTIINSTILNSNINMTFTINSTIINSTKFNSTNLHCTALASNETHTICQSSNLTNSNLTKSTVNNSQILNSTIINGTITNSNLTISNIINSTIINSTITNSNITNSNITNSTIINSTIIGDTLIGETIINLIHLDTCGTIGTNGRTYRLIKDLSSLGNCFNITASESVLNCNGFVISFGSATNAIGINVTGLNNISIRKCSIIGARATGSDNSGIFFNNVTNSTIENSTILTNGTVNNNGILLLSSSSNIINNNTISTNGTSVSVGILIQGNSLSNIFFDNNITTRGTGSDAFRLDSIGVNFPERNNITNNTLNNITGKDFNINTTTTINFTALIDQPIKEYNFTGLGGILIIKNSSFGEIRFLVAVNGSGNNLNFNSTADIRIENNFIFVNDTRNPGLNKSANITLFGTPGAGFTTPVILRNGIQCTSTTTPSCSSLTSLSAATVVFNVSGFSDYSIGEGAEAPSGAPAPAAAPAPPAAPAVPAPAPPAPPAPPAVIEAIAAEKGPVVSASETLALESFINLSIFARKEAIPVYVSYKEGDIVITIVNRSILSFTTIDVNPSYALDILPEAVIQTFMDVKEINSALLERVPSSLKETVLNILTQKEYPKEKLEDLKAFIKEEDLRLEKEIKDAEEKLKILKENYEEISIKASKVFETSIESKEEFDLSKESEDLNKANGYFNLLKKLSIEENNLAIKAARGVENLDTLKVVNDLIVNIGSALGFDLKVPVKPVEEEKIIVEKFEREEKEIKPGEELIISREIKTDLLNKIEGLSREFIDSKLKVGLTANVLVLFGKNYKMDLIKLEDDKAILKLKGSELRLNLGEPVLVDLNNDGRYEALILYKQKISKDIANIIIREIPIDLQKEILKGTEEAKEEIERQEKLETEIKNVLDTTVAVNFAFEFFIKGENQQLTIKTVTEEYATILFNDILYSIAFNKPVKLDLDRDNVLDSIVTYEKFFNENIIKLRIDEIVELKQEINEELLKTQEEAFISTKPLYDSFAALTSHAGVFSLYDKNYAFNLKEVNKDKIKLNIENQDYPINIGQPMRIDINGDDVFDISVTYEKFINDETIKIKIEQITGFGSVTSLAVQEISSKVGYVIFAVIIVAVLMFIFSLILWFVRSSRRF